MTIFRNVSAIFWTIIKHFLLRLKKVILAEKKSELDIKDPNLNGEVCSDQAPLPNIMNNFFTNKIPLSPIFNFFIFADYMTTIRPNSFIYKPSSANKWKIFWFQITKASIQLLVIFIWPGLSSYQFILNWSKSFKTQYCKSLLFIKTTMAKKLAIFAQFFYFSQ